ncbi:MAG: branched-chain amino acid ABC transporter permease [Actinomycetota bacterium]|nr:branched-chain amino acid ABC transporter permease [Actinomycetota bacterium]
MITSNMSKSRLLPRTLGAVLVLVALAALPYVIPSFYVFVATRILILGLLATAYNLVFGYAGFPALGHAAFFGLGGYTVGLGITKAELGFGWILILAILIGALMGIIMGALCLKVRGIYLLLLTLALGQALFGLVFYQVELTGGDNGIANIERLGVPGEQNAFYLFTLVIVVVCLAAMWIFVKSPVGMVITGLRESESRIDATGYSVATYTIVVFAVSGAFSAVAGMLDTYLQGSVSPGDFNWLVSAEVMIFAILGGTRYFMGPFVGAAIVLLLEVYTSTFTERWTSVLGVIYVLTALLLTGGVLGLLDKLRSRHRKDDLPDTNELPLLTGVQS